MKKTRKLALSAVLCAMGVIILYFGAVEDRIRKHHGAWIPCC